MNHDENKPDMQTWIEPELEARVVAWVSGEASAFESAELERLVSEKPELALFKQRIEAVRGLVAEAVRPDPAPLRLAPERRSKFLETLRAADGTPSAEEVGKKSDALAAFPLHGARKPRRARWWQRTGTIAAGLMLGLFFSTLIKYSANQYADEESREKKPSAAMLRSSAERNEVPASAKYAGKKAGTFDLRRGLDGTPPFDPDGANFKERRQVDSFNTPAQSDRRVDKDIAGLSPSRSLAQGRADFYVPPRLTENSSLSASRIAPPLRYKKGGVLPSGPPPPPDLPSRLNLGYIGSAQPAQSELSKDKAERESDQRFNLRQIARPAPPSSDDLNRGEQTPTSFSSSGTLKAEASAGARSDEARLASDEEVVTLSPFEVATRGEIAAGLANPSLQANGQAKNDLALSDQKKPIAEKVATIEAPASEVIAPTSQDAAAPEPASPAASMPKPAEQITPLIQEINAKLQPVSTFSLHVSDVSFRLAQAALAAGELPGPERIRPEEFYNAFNYGDPAPAMAEKISCRIEQSAFPFLQQRNLVRIAMKVPAVGHGVSQPLRLTVMLDTSGSMEREDRAATVSRAMKILVSLLGPNDRLTVIGFARQPRLIVDQLSGDKAGEALTAIAQTPSEGGTDLEAALKLASELALRSRESTAQNRIVLLTDGAANLGDADPAQLASAIEALRQQGVAFDACGVGLDGIDDAMLERLTRKGDGRYYVLNTPEAAESDFARQLAGAFRPAAENVKVQVRFNPNRVGAYRLIGFEQHRLKEEDFRNDQVDAAELAAEEAAIAVYQVETLPQGEGEVGEVYVRFRDASNGNMVERSWTLAYDPQVAAFDRATPSLQLAGIAVLLAEKLRGGGLADSIRLEELAPVVNALRGHYSHEPRVQELAAMYEQLQRLKHE